MTTPEGSGACRHGGCLAGASAEATESGGHALGGGRHRRRGDGPALAVVPWTTTVSPGCEPVDGRLGVSRHVVEGVSVTTTRFPLALVT